MTANTLPIRITSLTFAVLSFAGCLDDSVPVPQPDAESLPRKDGYWNTQQQDDLAIGFSYTTEPGAACSVRFDVQGAASRHQPIAGWVIDTPMLDDLDGPEGALVRVATNDVNRLAGAEAWAAGQELKPSDRPFEPEWQRNATVTFTSAGTGTAWFAAKNLHNETGGKTAGLTFDCAGAWEISDIQPAADALLIRDLPAQGTTSLRLDGRAQASVGDVVNWKGHAPSHVYGYVHGTPSKALVIEIEHPEGTETWCGLPTTFLAATGLEPIGGARFAFHGTDPGAHALRISGAGAPALLHSMVVLEA